MAGAYEGRGADAGGASRRAGGVLVLSDGGMASLVACAIERERVAQGIAERGIGPRVAVAPWALAGGGEGWERDRRIRSIARQVELLGFELMGELESRGRSIQERESEGLLKAAQHAAREGFERLVWPVQGVRAGEVGTAGLDLEWTARVVDKAVLVGRLVAVDANEHQLPGFKVEVPLADLSDEQLADLALDLDAPVQACWWFDDEGSPERARWTRVLRSAGWTVPPPVITLASPKAPVG